MVNRKGLDSKGKLIEVENFRCFNCHEKNIHYIHSRILMKLCSFCHSNVFAREYSKEELRKIGFNITLEKREEVKEFEGPTILKIFYSIINAILSIFK